MSDDTQQPAAQTVIPWEIAITRSWRKIAITFLAALAAASLIWQATHRNLIYDFVFNPQVVAQGAYDGARAMLVKTTVLTGLVALVLGALVLRRVRRGGAAGPLHRETLLAAAMPLPLLTIPTIEFDNPWFTGAVVLTFALALAWTVSHESIRLPTLRDLSAREATVLVGAAVVLFAGTIGFISYWRYITFHAQLCDSSWETNAIWGILRRGYPTTSVAPWMYPGQALPAIYFNNHVPLGSYLYIPFFALYPDTRTLVWLQAVFMALGAIGAYFMGQHWLHSRVGGVLAAWLYVLNPNVQSLCLHDIHPNILVIPLVILAAGFMEANRPRTAIVFAFLTAICHEETPIYAAGLGIYWMFSGEDRRRFRIGLGTCVFAVGLALFFSLYLMPRFGGKPNWNHFSFFFAAKQSAGSLLSAIVLNPLGAAMKATSALKLDFLAMALIPIGGMALLGWRAGWFALPALLLLLPSDSPGFFCPGMNYSAPFVPPVLMMGLAGAGRLWGAGTTSNRQNKIFVGTYVVACALLGNYLYGNIAPKSFKLEYGFSPLRRQNQYNYRDMLGYMDALPAFGPTEKALWQVINRIPPEVPVMSSWAINPQIANRDISLSFEYSGGSPPPEERVDYIVIDKLPAMQSANEPHIARFRKDPRFTLFYENNGGVIFQRLRN